MPDALPYLRRTCRSCGFTAKLDLLVGRCPDCDEPFGAVQFGLDHDPAEFVAGVKQQATEADERYRRELERTRRELAQTPHRPDQPAPAPEGDPS